MCVFNVLGLVKLPQQAYIIARQKAYRTVKTQEEESNYKVKQFTHNHAYSPAIYATAYLVVEDKES